MEQLLELNTRHRAEFISDSLFEASAVIPVGGDFYCCMAFAIGLFAGDSSRAAGVNRRRAIGDGSNECLPRVDMFVGINNNVVSAAGCYPVLQCRR